MEGDARAFDERGTIAGAVGRLPQQVCEIGVQRSRDYAPVCYRGTMVRHDLNCGHSAFGGN